MHFEEARNRFGPPSRRWVIVLAVVAVCAVVVFALPPIPQALEYHQFADRRAFFGEPNFFDVVSNVPFAIVGIWGLAVAFRRQDHGIFASPWERRAYAVLFIGVTLTAFGSAYYHLAPDNDRLVWDRLPMAVGFMGLLTAIIAERVSASAARALLVPLLVVGCASVVYWHWTELQGAGDLRLYVLVQFGSLVVVVLLLLLYPPRYPGISYLVAGLIAYASAKVFESADRIIFDEVGVSGHTLKHLAAAAGVACIVAMLHARRGATAAVRSVGISPP
jgi:hypothetical protein